MELLFGLVAVLILAAATAAMMSQEERDRAFQDGYEAAQDEVGEWYEGPDEPWHIP